MILGSQHAGVAKLQSERSSRGVPVRGGITRKQSGWEGPVAQAIDAAAVNLRGRADGIAGGRHAPEFAGVRTQHTLAEELLGAVPPARQ